MSHGTMSDFETVPVGTLAELAQVKAERDAALEQVIYWRERAMGAEAEQDALAAHVERIAAYKDRLEAKKIMPARLAGIIEEHPTTSKENRDD